MRMHSLNCFNLISFYSVLHYMYTLKQGKNMTIRLKPFFSYYGSKFMLSKHYPPPKYKTIIEPFAGAAAYSCFYPNRKVILYDLFEDICQIWQYLINVKEEEIQKLPLVHPGDHIDDFKISEEAKLLIGYWLGFGNCSRRKQISLTSYNWQLKHPGQVSTWSDPCKARIIKQLQYIRHWKIKKACYSEIPKDHATWFVDPPYQKKGVFYKHNQIDYEHLSYWCLNRFGQLIACEQTGANWLPFKSFKILRNNKHQKTSEAIYTQNCDEQLTLF